MAGRAPHAGVAKVTQAWLSCSFFFCNRSGSRRMRGGRAVRQCCVEPTFTSDARPALAEPMIDSNLTVDVPNICAELLLKVCAECRNDERH